MSYSLGNPFVEALPSLLWPPDYPRDNARQVLTDQQALDLGLDVLIRALDWDGHHARFVRATLLELVADPVVIAYRQAILAELVANDVVRGALAALLPALAELSRPRSAAWTADAPLLTVPPRVSDLEMYVACVDGLYAALNGQAVEAAGLRHLHAQISATRNSAEFQSLRAELPKLRARLDQISSITLGINLDRDLRPASAALLDIRGEPFTAARTLAQRLLGQQPHAGPRTLTALRNLTTRAPDDPLVRDLQNVLAEVVEPVALALESYARIHARPLAALEPELSFYLGAAQCAQRLQALGLPVCLPICSTTQHTLTDAYNPALALQLAHAAQNGVTSPGALIRNPINFDLGRIIFLTGPNRGGKTTYLRAVGLNQVLFQAGIYVAAAQAVLTPADTILTHFPPIEGVEPGQGRLDDEARRVRTIFAGATPHSLLLFNEPLTSTGEGEARALAEDLLRALRLLGARTVYVTHLHALAEALDALNAGPGAAIVSWVAGVDDAAGRTYRIRPGSPTARSLAATIAQQHGITYEQLVQQLADRGVIVAALDLPSSTEEA